MIDDETGTIGADVLPAETDADPLSDELVIEFRKPITLGKGDGAVTYSEMTLREPTASDMAEFTKLSGTESDILAIHLISGLPKRVIEQLGARDLTKAARYIGAFLA